MITVMTREQQFDAYSKLCQRHERLYSQNIGFIFDRLIRLEYANVDATKQIEKLQYLNDGMRNSLAWRLRTLCQEVKNVFAR
jgi:hypothetical protein